MARTTIHHKRNMSIERSITARNDLSSSSGRNTRNPHAAACFAHAVQANPRFSVIYVMRASALALAGRIEEAQRTARQLLELDPTFRLGALIDFGGFAQPDILDAVAIGARQAGLPSCDDPRVGKECQWPGPRGGGQDPAKPPTLPEA